MDVDCLHHRQRVRKSLTQPMPLGTSQGVAQAVMWRVCNDLPFETMAAQAGKVMNEPEIALAARFVEALDDRRGPTWSTQAADRRPGLRADSGGRCPGRAMPSGSTSSSRSYRLLGLPISVVDRASCRRRRPRSLHQGRPDRRARPARPEAGSVVSYARLPISGLRWARRLPGPSSLAVLDGEALSPEHSTGRSPRRS